MHARSILVAVPLSPRPEVIRHKEGPVLPIVQIADVPGRFTVPGMRTGKLMQCCRVLDDGSVHCANALAGLIQTGTLPFYLHRKSIPMKRRPEAAFPCPGRHGRFSSGIHHRAVSLSPHRFSGWWLPGSRLETSMRSSRPSFHSPIRFQPAPSPVRCSGFRARSFITASGVIDAACHQTDTGRFLMTEPLEPLYPPLSRNAQELSSSQSENNIIVPENILGGTRCRRRPYTLFTWIAIRFSASRATQSATIGAGNVPGAAPTRKNPMMS